MSDHRDSRPDRLDWAEVDFALVYELEQAICEANGVVSKMFGAYGKYYKISWYIDGVPGMVSDYDTKRLEEKIRAALCRGFGTSRGAHA